MDTCKNRKDSPINRIQNQLVKEMFELTNQNLNLMREVITEDIEHYNPFEAQKNLTKKEDKKSKSL